MAQGCNVEESITGSSYFLEKKGRSYDVVLFEIDYLANCYVCVPFRTEMKHNNDYKFIFLIGTKSSNQD